MKTSCITIDNHPEALKLLEEYIIKTRSLDLKGQFNNCTDALAFLQEHPVGVIFTDIGMPVMTGLELADALSRDQKFIFITENEKYALQSFQYHVIDYVLKPISYKRFLRVVEKIARSGANQPVHVQTAADHLFAKSAGKTVRISFDDILYIKGEKEYVSLHFKDGRLLIYKRMKQMEGLLPSNFMRIHISYIINIDRLEGVSAKHVIIAKEKIPIGGSYRVQLQKHIDLQIF